MLSLDWFYRVSFVTHSVFTVCSWPGKSETSKMYATNCSFNKLHVGDLVIRSDFESLLVLEVTKTCAKILCIGGKYNGNIVELVTFSCVSLMREGTQYEWRNLP